MPLSKNKLQNILYKQNIDLIEFLLNDISKKYDIPIEELETEYISQFKIVKRNTNKKGKMNGYSIFLKDKEVDEDLRTRFPEKAFGQLSKLKGETWRNMSDIDKKLYKEKAIAFNLTITNKE